MAGSQWAACYFSRFWRDVVRKGENNGLRM
jgi:hypothetical protein